MTRVSNENVFLRNDTIFGTCQSIGDDFGFNANWLRAPLAAAMLASPVGAILFYVGLSVVVLFSRLVFRSQAVPATATVTPAGQHLVEANDDGQRELAAA